MKKIFTFSKIGSLRLAIISITTTFALGYGYYSSTTDGKYIREMNEGISTCSHRANQSFTAKMIGDKNSVYLQNDFMNLTEDCFADSIASFNLHLANRFSSLGNLLNNLATEVHGLHEKILLASTDTATLSKAFEKIESGRNLATDELEISIAKSLTNQTMMLFSLVASFFLMAFIVMREMVASFQEFSRSQKLEEEAKAELVNQDENHVQNVEAILTKVFDQGGMAYAAQLFNSYKNYWQDKSIVAQAAYAPSNFPQRPQTKVVYIEQPARTHEHIINESIALSNDLNNDEAVNLTETMAKVVNLLSGKAFSNGVILDFDLSSTIYVKGQSEAIQQIIFNLISHAINNNLNNQPAKKISASLTTSGNEVNLKFNDNSQIYTQTLVQSLNAHLNNVDDVGLAISKEFIKESRGELHVKNLLDFNGNITGSITEVTLRLANVTAKEQDNNRVVTVIKGKKKDFRKKFKNRENRMEA